MMAVDLDVRPPEGEGEGERDGGERNEWEERDEDEQDLVALAETYFRGHELLRASWVLKNTKGGKARWLRCYAKFLVRPLLPSLLLSNVATRHCFTSRVRGRPD